ncbi:MAG TPA: DUF1707 and FHA domain-containing protein [Thermoleophilaceae bacterium]|nr:DUF1707 and FHA domain-containing protein [Thermoleophilaceae bacterium]
MAVDPPTPTTCRPSADDRERALIRLRAGLADERLSLETYSNRLDGAYAAQSVAELDALLVDLPRRPGVGRVLESVAARMSRLTARIQRGWAEARAPLMALPGRAITLGRARDCDCVLSDLTVSRRHARIDFREGAWFLSDLRSANGTLVNGLRVIDEVPVRPGDRVTFGAITYRLRPPLRP